MGRDESSVATDSTTGNELRHKALLLLPNCAYELYWTVKALDTGLSLMNQGGRVGVVVVEASLIVIYDTKKRGVGASSASRGFCGN